MTFIYQIEKKELEENIELNIFSVNEKKETILEKKYLKYQILTRKKDFEDFKLKNDNIKINSKFKLKNKEGDEIVKLEINNKELFEYIKSEFRDLKIEVFEADLIDEHRYLIDNDIKISNSNKEIDFKYLSIDIETIYENPEIISISTCSNVENSMNKVYFNCDKFENKKIIEKLKKNNSKKLKNKEYEIIYCENENELLKKFKKDIIEFNPQLIIGWSVIDFDFKVIRNRMKANEIKFNFSKYEEKEEKESKIRIFNDFFKDSTLNISGIIVFDIIAILKTNFISFKDYKLDTVSSEVLGDNKINLFDEEKEENENPEKEKNFDKGKAIELLFQNNPEKLIEYNFKDSKLVIEIVEKLKLIKLMQERSILTGTPISKVKSPIASLDIMYLKELHKQKLVAKSNFNYSSSSPIQGAYVIEPKSGFYENIFVFDFKSLYPSVIMTFNIDPFTYDKKGEILSPNGARFKTKSGILPKLILQLYKERDIAKSKKDDVKSFALKTTMNSFYGAMASSKSRLHNSEVGGAITAFSREVLKNAKSFVEKENIGEVRYGDTDSLFVEIKDLKDKSFKEKQKIGIKIEKKINNYFDSYIKKDFNQKSYLIIENEKIFSKFFIASKKRYVGIDEFTNKTKFVGMEAIRGDWTDLAKNFQKRLVEIIFDGGKKEEITNFIFKYIEKLKNSEFDKDLIYTKKITKPLEEYTKMTPPHVKAARELPKFNGRIVKYVLTENGAKHIDLINKKTKFDYEHYINKQLKGVSSDLLKNLELDFEDIIKSKSQKSLNRFF